MRDEFWNSSMQTGAPDPRPKFGSSGHTLPLTAGVNTLARYGHAIRRGGGGNLSELAKLLLILRAISGMTV
jgi:hypothetical protein